MGKKSEKISASATPPHRPSEPGIKTSKSGRVTYGTSPKGQPPRVKSKSALFAAIAASMVPTRKTPQIRHPVKGQSKGAFSKTASKANTMVQSRLALIWSRKR